MLKNLVDEIFRSFWILQKIFYRLVVAHANNDFLIWAHAEKHLKKMDNFHFILKFN